MPVQVPTGHSARDEADRIRIMRRAATDNLHATGLIVRKIPKAISQTMSANVDVDADHPAGAAPELVQPWDQFVNAPNISDATKLRRKAARNAFMVLSELYMRGLCSAPVSRDFVLRNIFGHYRTDAEIFVGLHSFVSGNPAATQLIRPACVTVCGESDRVDLLNSSDFSLQRDRDYRDANDDQDYAIHFFNEQDQPEVELNADVQNGKVLEIDLVCSARPAQQQDDTMVSVRGSAGALLLHVIVDMLSRKSRGTLKFKRVITYVAGSQAQGFPLESTLLRMNFRRVNAKARRIINGQQEEENRYRPLSRRYYVLDNVDGNRFVKLAQALPWDTNRNDTFMANVCPTVPRTGFTYCV